MERIETRFGIVEYDPDNTLIFPEGLPGFEELRRFLVMPNPSGGPFSGSSPLRTGALP